MPNPKRLETKTILLIVTGSIAAYKIGDLVRDLRQEGAEVVCVMTRTAKHFVTPLVLSAISGGRVYEDLFSTDSGEAVVHTALAEQADAILVAPASANFMARTAVGMADDLPACLVLAAQSPVIYVPAMNDCMYLNPATQHNKTLLKERGAWVIEPIEGHLVCGKEAVGHISDNATIIENLCGILQPTA